LGEALKLVSFDPGENTGWAVLDPESEGHLLKNFGTTKGKKELVELLRDLETPYVQLQIVIEDYTNRPKSAGGFDHTWDKGYTHRVIGIIEGWAIRHNFKIAFSKPVDKAPAYGVVGLTYVKGKQNQHHMDAIVHGFHYIWKNKLAPMNKIIDAMAGKK
jgi:hypothetical protein